MQVFLPPWYFLCYFQQSPNTADPISGLPEEETCRISDTSCPFSLAGRWQNPPFVGPLGDQQVMLGAEQAFNKVGWSLAPGECGMMAKNCTQKPTGAPRDLLASLPPTPVASKLGSLTAHTLPQPPGPQTDATPGHIQAIPLLKSFP